MFFSSVKVIFLTTLRVPNAFLSISGSIFRGAHTHTLVLLVRDKNLVFCIIMCPCVGE